MPFREQTQLTIPFSSTKKFNLSIFFLPFFLFSFLASPMNLNSPPPPQISNDIIINNNDQPYHPFAPINHYPNSSSVSCHFFFNSTQDHNMGYYHDHHQLYLPDDNQHHGSNNQCEMKNKIDQSGLKLSLWGKEDGEKNTIVQHNNNNNSNPVKWMSSKMRLMHKMKTQPGRVTLKITTGSSKIKDQTSSLETTTDNFSSNYNNSPIRVCSDCNTTKTPLWRSGPKGPKSLCNACGIRQRKARRAMAAAAASGTAVAANTASLKIKAKNGPIKKRCKAAGPTSEEGSASTAEEEKKNSGLEDFLINLSKNLTLHRVFPEDEKDAAILLMALSSGLVHG